MKKQLLLCALFYSITSAAEAEKSQVLRKALDTILIPLLKKHITDERQFVGFNDHRSAEHLYISSTEVDPRAARLCYLITPLGFGKMYLSKEQSKALFAALQEDKHLKTYLSWRKFQDGESTDYCCITKIYEPETGECYYKNPSCFTPDLSTDIKKQKA